MDKRVGNEFQGIGQVQEAAKQGQGRTFNDLVGVIKLLLYIYLYAGLAKRRNKLCPTRRPSHPLRAHIRSQLRKKANVKLEQKVPHVPRRK